MPILYIPVGIPGCGKSSYSASINVPYVVSSDAIREQITGDATNQDVNSRVFELFYEDIETNLMHSQGWESVYADATNLDPRSRHELIKIAARHGASTHLILFRNLGQAIKRNAERARVVPADVMMRMIEKYERAVASIDHHETYTYVTEVSSIR